MSVRPLPLPSAGRDGPLYARKPTIGVRRGKSALQELGTQLDELHRETRTPIMARRPWLETWAACYQDHEPWAVYVQANGRIIAAALLASRRRRGILEVVRMGHGATDHARLPAIGQDPALRLASALIAELDVIRGPWTLFVGQLPPQDPVARQIVADLHTASIVPGDGSPTVRFERGRSLEEYVPRKVRSNVRTRTNRMQREGLSPIVLRLRDGEEIARFLPEADRVRRERDAALGRRSKLDDARYLRFRHAVLLKLAEAGDVEVTALRVGGELVAYQIGLLDGDVYRQWDSRFHPAWSHFGPGTLVNSTTLGWVLEDQRFEEFDFMRGTHPHKMEFATAVEPAETLIAFSSSLTRQMVELEDHLKHLVRATSRRLQPMRRRREPREAMSSLGVSSGEH